MRLKEFDQQYGKYILGIDEAGCGCLCGPVTVGAVLLDITRDIDESLINDSKKLSEKRREKAFTYMSNELFEYKFYHRDSKFIDKVGILNAVKDAMREAINDLGGKADTILIDGHEPRRPQKGKNILMVTKGDAKSLTIGAASIVAKYQRDKIMLELSQKYDPENKFGMKKNKGYPTKQHRAYLKECGPTDIHRLSYKPCQVNVI